MSKFVNRMTNAWNARYGEDGLYLTPTRVFLVAGTVFILVIALFGIADMALSDPAPDPMQNTAARGC